VILWLCHNSESSGCENTEFVHVKDIKCTLDSCTKSKKRKHTVVVKGVTLCPHSLLCHLRNKQAEETIKKDSNHYIDYRLTIKDVIAKVKKNSLLVTKIVGRVTS
jgi:hypothetical protein